MKRSYIIAAVGTVLLIVVALAVGSNMTKEDKKPTKQKTESQSKSQNKQKDPVATTELPPLPTDNKQAIDSELQDIEKSIQEVDSALSTDTADGELGL